MRHLQQILVVTIVVSTLVGVRPCAAEDPPQFQQAWGVSGTAPSQFQHPSDMKVAANNTVYVTDTDNKRIQIFSNSGQFLSQIVSGVGNAAFGFTLSCAVDNAGNVYIQDDRSRIDVFDSAGQFIRSWPSRGLFLALDPTGTYLYVNTTQDSIIEYNAATGNRVTAWGYYSGQTWQGFAVGPSGAIYIASSATLLKFSPDGGLLGSWGGLGSGAGQFNSARGVAVDPLENVYVVDASNARIQKFSMDGDFLSAWGAYGANVDQFSHAIYAVAADNAGHVFVLDHDLDRVQEFGYTATPVRNSGWGELKQLYK